MIDKFVPRHLNTDSDQRYLEEGDLVDAVNITLNEDGANSAIVLKNIRGTRSYTYANYNDRVPDYPMTVIGSVSDPQRSRVYVFAASDTDNADYDDIIFMIDMNTDQYSVVFRTASSENTIGGLRFDPNSFIKADVLNRDVQRNGTIQSILYFTDNVNLPRKINVDRALAGEYEQYTADQLRFVINSIVPAPTREPIFTFETDTSVTDNNLLGRCFQFATQFVFNDGEESAISPYSKLAFVDESRTSAVVFDANSPNEPAIFSSLREENNVCVIDTKFATGFDPDLVLNESVETPDVENIRILAREDNDGAWFVVDEVPVNETTTRNIAGTSVAVFNPQSGLYRFYNDAGYRTVSSLQSDKLYDNVPRIARGQAISGNRLAYSNYIEGYNNAATLPSITITPEYIGPETADGNGGIDTSNLVTFVTTGDANVDDGSIKVDWTALFTSASDQTYALEEGSQTVLSFSWTPRGTVQNNTTASDDEVLMQFEGTDSDGNNVRFGVGSPDQTDNSIFIGPAIDANVEDSNRWFVNYQYVAEEGDTIQDLADDFAVYIENLTWLNRFDYPLPGLNVGQITSGQDIHPSNKTGDTSTIAPTSRSFGQVKMRQSWKFVTESTGGVSYIHPHIFYAAIEENPPDEGQIFTTYGGVNPGFDPGSNPGSNFWNLSFQRENFGTGQGAETYDFSGAVGNSGTDVGNIAAASEAASTQLSFKAGALHEFGMMYYDRWNRNGPLIKLGSVYAKTIAERSATGPTAPVERKGAIHMNFNINGDVATIPDWARGYRILYAGNPYDSVFTGTVSNAFVPTDAAEQGATGASASTFDPDRREIYVSIEGIEKTKQFMSVNRSYSFAEGDVLRVVQYFKALSPNQGVNAPLSSTNTLIEFDVVRTVTLEDDLNNPLRSGTYSFGDLTDAGKTGRFLVLRAPEVDAGVQDSNNNYTKYPGFDWFHVAASQNGSVTADNRYPYDSDSDGTNDEPDTTNFWKQECVVEILSRRKRTSDDIYYEISPYRGLRIRRGGGSNVYGPAFTVDNGDMFFRPVLSTRNLFENSAWTDDPKKWQYKSIVMESERYSDRRTKADWGQGRAHLPLTEPQERRRYNSITYSEADVSDLNTLLLSSFDKNLSNFVDLNPNFGALNYIGAMGEQLIGVQENKVSRLSVDRQVIQSAQGDDVALALTSSPYNVDIYFSGDYGCGDNPESVLIQDNQVFFADVSRSAVCRLASSQLYAISEKRTSNLFNTIFDNVRAAANPRIVSGYDPANDTYYITFGNMGGNNETVGYNVFGGRGGDGGWISRYTFYPTNYSNQNNSMLSMSYYDPDNTLEYDQQLMHVHDGNAYNTFYGDYDQSDITYVSKPDPSMVKTYDALSHEGNSGNWVVQSINTNLMGANDNAGTLNFVEREGSYYAYITRDPGGSKHLRFLGTIASSTTNSITFDNKINNQPVPANAEMMAVVGGNLVTMSTTAGEALVQSVTGARTLGTLTANIDTAVATDGTQVVLRTPAALDSDPIRGHYATIRMTNNATAQFELYCVNTVLTPSQLHHNRGQ